MLKINILKASNINDSKVWVNYWEKLPILLQDVFFLPQYLEAYENENRGEALCALIIENHSFILYPFMKSKVPFDSTIIDGKDYYDIQSPYGYSGPLVNNEGNNPQFLENAWKLFDNWCIQNDIVSEFCRFHPLLENNIFSKIHLDIYFNRLTIAMDLISYEKNIWNESFYLNHRGMVRKAMREEYKFCKEKFTTNIKWFTEKYNETQKALNAETETYFSEQYFNTLDKLNERIWLGVLKKNDKPITAVVVIEGNQFAYLHLMAYFNEGPSKGMVNYLYHEVALECEKNGKKLLQVGGGKTSSTDDPLFLFKTRLSPIRHNYFIGKKIHLKSIYEKLKIIYKEKFGEEMYEKNKHLVQFYRN